MTALEVLIRTVHDYQQTIESLQVQLATANARIAELEGTGADHPKDHTPQVAGVRGAGTDIGA